MESYRLIPVDEIRGHEAYQRWTLDECAYLTKIIPGRSHVEIAELASVHFATCVTENQVVSFIGNHKASTGRTGRFEKGHVPANKGTTGIMHGSSTSFKKGIVPMNVVAIGTEKLRQDGYLYVKIQDGCKNANWKQKHIIVWEQANGPVPVGGCVVFIDWDTTNCSIDNLILIDRALLATLNRYGLLRMGQTRETVEASILIARVKHGISQASKRQHG